MIDSNDNNTHWLLKTKQTCFVDYYCQHSDLLNMNVVIWYTGLTADQWEIVSCGGYPMNVKYAGYGTNIKGAIYYYQWHVHDYSHIIIPSLIVCTEPPTFPKGMYRTYPLPWLCVHDPPPSLTVCTEPPSSQYLTVCWEGQQRAQEILVQNIYGIFKNQ